MQPGQDAQTAQEPQTVQEPQPQYTQPAQEPQAAPQYDEPRTPYQTPVQHPDYQPPHADQTYYSAPQPQQDFAGGPQPPKKKGHGKAIVSDSAAWRRHACCLRAERSLGMWYPAGTADRLQPVRIADPTACRRYRSATRRNSIRTTTIVVNGLAGEEIYKKVSPAVVSVIATLSNGTGSGSGVIMSADGLHYHQ